MGHFLGGRPELVSEQDLSNNISDDSYLNSSICSITVSKLVPNRPILMMEYLIPPS